jgi:hypothetical protein
VREDAGAVGSSPPLRRRGLFLGRIYGSAGRKLRVENTKLVALHRGTIGVLLPYREFKSEHVDVLHYPCWPRAPSHLSAGRSRGARALVAAVMAAFGGEFRWTSPTFYNFSANTTTLFFFSILLTKPRCNTNEHERHSLQPLAALRNAAERAVMARMQLTIPLAAFLHSRELAEIQDDHGKLFEGSETLKGMCSLFLLVLKSFSLLCRVTKMRGIISTLLYTTTFEVPRAYCDSFRRAATLILQVAEHIAQCGRC